MCDVVEDTVRETATTVEDDPWDLELVDDISSPTMEHVDDNGIGTEILEELLERLSENGGVCGGAGGHVDVGDFEVWRQSKNGDGKAGMLVSGDGLVELKRVREGSDDDGVGSVRCRSYGGVDHGDLMASSHKREEDHLYRGICRNHCF